LQASTFGILLSIIVNLSISLSNSPPSASPKPLAASITNKTTIMNDNQIIRNVLITKFSETQREFNDTIYHLLFDSRKWVEEALLFKLSSEVRRRNIKDWSPDINHEWDSVISTNYNLNPETLKVLLDIQPIDFWVLYLKMPIYEHSINNLTTHLSKTF
jgi:hypothetical protein